ncbi:hypothetical protein TNCV_2131981 [Trichonephila clavipes]|nr:hypothetical protein TNCV_2131981 [Trichonephila clavipes]
MGCVGERKGINKEILRRHCQGPFIAFQNLWINFMDNSAQKILHFGKTCIYVRVSHTTDDLIFDWDESVPLVVSEDIELPQLDLIQTEKKDCTQHYSTGKHSPLIQVACGSRVV